MTKSSSSLGAQSSSVVSENDEEQPGIRATRSATLVAIREGKFKKGKENEGFLSMVLQAVQTLDKFTECIVCKVHIGIANESENVYFLYSEWSSEEGYMKSCAEAGEHESVIEQIVRRSADQDGFKEKPGREIVKKSNSFTLEKGDPNVQAEGVQEISKDITIETNEFGSKHFMERISPTELWIRKNEDDMSFESSSCIQTNDDDYPFSKENFDTRKMAAFVMLCHTQCRRNKYDEYMKLLIKASESALSEEGCVKYTFHTRHSIEEKDLERVNLGKGMMHHIEERAKLEISDVIDIMVYAVFVTEDAFMNHRDKDYSISNPSSILVAEGIPSMSFWRRTDFPITR